ncbi:M15 family metallopeptidase [Ensifer soli]|uniref:M15 family metallopeptidase n=1 Tax=Ciceribacter sp. sgz301302 TaxID=3342379 RepID=UPI0035B7C2FE
MRSFSRKAAACARKAGLRRIGLAVIASLAASPVLAAGPTLEQKVSALVSAYPETIAGAGDGMLMLRDGTRIAIDDGKVRDHAAKLVSGDIEDSLAQPYPAGACETRPERNADPGRIRSEALMKALYGSSAGEVKRELVPVPWFGETLRVTRRQGVDRALAAVRDELSADADLKAFLSPSAGVFNWRRVAGQRNLSVHSFGAAIDLNTAHADYWVWAGGRPGRVPEYRNRFPMAIVEAFERHGFIWGGRWYHFDTMHFEYRPELLAIARLGGVSACR